MIQWLQNLQGGAATGNGAMVGSTIGFVALVAGALFNAKLNCNRDAAFGVSRRDQLLPLFGPN